jgi:Retroviral aspartyl protease
MHPLSTKNRFAVLSIDEMTELDLISSTDSMWNNVKAIPQPPPPVQALALSNIGSTFATMRTSSPSISVSLRNSHFHRRPNWEKRLPDRFVVASAISDNSLELSIALQTTDTGEVFSTAALLDCGATDKFIHSNFVKCNCITTRLLSRPIPIYNVDGTLNEAGSITKVVEMMLRYRDHSEKTLFAVTGLGKQDVILGLTWLRGRLPGKAVNTNREHQKDRIKLSSSLHGSGNVSTTIIE